MSPSPALATPSSGEPPLTVRFQYTHGPGTESCPDEHRAHDILMSAFGYDAIKPDAGPLIQIDLSRRGPELHAEITITDSDGKLLWVDEKHGSGRCSELLRTAAVGAVVMTELALNRLQPARPPAPEPAEPERPAPASPRAPPSKPHPRKAARPSVARALSASPAPHPLMVRLGAAMEIHRGLLPGFGAGGAFLVTLDKGPLSFSSELRLLGSINPDYTRQGREVRGLFFGGAAVPCLHARPFMLCASAGIGLVHASADNLPLLTVDNPLVVMAGARPGIEAALGRDGRFMLRVFGELSGILTETNATVNYTPAWTTPRVSVALALGVTVRP